MDAPVHLQLPPDLRLTPEQFALVCAENREAVLELAADGRVITMRPTGSETGSRNGELFFQLKLYAKHAGGWKAFDSSTPTYQANGAQLSWLLLPHEQAVEAWPASGPRPAAGATPGAGGHAGLPRTIPQAC